MAERKIRVLIVDDSAIVRKIISEALGQDPEIEVIGTAMDPYIARDKIVELKPDVLTLDIEMPRMDGLTFLKILMQHKPMPVILISALTQAGSEHALKALQLGAVEVLAKPEGSSLSVGELAEQLIEKVKAAAVSRVHKKEPSSVPQEPLAPLLVSNQPFDPRQIILLGASTGGTEALKEIIPCLPKNMPGICIVQHIPPYFSKAFADRLNTLSELEVREAVEGDVVRPGLALIAPGDYHMLLKQQGGQYFVSLKKGPRVWHQRPAVDILFFSASECVHGPSTVVGLLTGMGRDGAEGMLKLKQLGAKTFAQDEKSCVVFGMPKEAMEIGAVSRMLSLKDFARHLLSASIAARKGSG